MIHRSDTGCLKIDATHLYDNSYCIKLSFIWILKSYRITSERSNQMTTAEIDWLYPTVHAKDQVLEDFLDSFRPNLLPHSHCQDILPSTSCQMWDFVPSCCGGLLTLWLETWILNDEFGFPGDNCLLKLLEKLCLHIFERLYFQINFPLLSKHCDRELIVRKVYYFQIWNKTKTLHC